MLIASLASGLGAPMFTQTKTHPTTKLHEWWLARELWKIDVCVGGIEGDVTTTLTTGIECDELDGQ